MAKRRRLTPAPGLELGPEAAARFARETPPPERRTPLPPIAAMTGESAQHAAGEALAAELAAARREGRLAEALPLEAVVADHLIRDRASLDEEEMSALIESLRARGQQVPVEVTAIGDGRYGLISGWRRLEALRRLAAEGQGPGTVAAVVRRPDGAAAAYVAMVEENEIRADLGFWERGRIVARAVEAGVFPDVRAALGALFGAVPRAKRSKIGSFVRLVQDLDGVLRFPEALTERSGLAVAKILKGASAAEVAGFARDLGAAVAGARTAEDERDLLQAFLAGRAEAAGPVATDPPNPAGGTRSGGVRGAGGGRADPEVRVRLRTEAAGTTLVLEGPGVGPALKRRLEAWLRASAERDAG